MREHESGRPRTPRRWHSWIKRISSVAVHVSAASLLASGMASSLAARKGKNRHDDRGAGDQGDPNRDGRGNDPHREGKHASDFEADRGSQRENRLRSDGDGDGGASHRSGKRESQVDESSDVRSAQTTTPTPTPTSGGGGDGGNRDGGGSTDGGGGKGDGGGNDAGNAGSGLFDRPLATKARRRSNDFENADRDEVDGIIVDVHPEGESVYETDSITFITGPDGLEIQTDNISYFAEATPTPEPLSRIELPVREAGFPFGEDFPFGNATVADRSAAREPSDPGDTSNALAPRAKPLPDSGSSEPANSDGGDNTMDFLS